MGHTHDVGFTSNGVVMAVGWPVSGRWSKPRWHGHRHAQRRCATLIESTSPPPALRVLLLVGAGGLFVYFESFHSLPHKKICRNALGLDVI